MSMEFSNNFLIGVNNPIFRGKPIESIFQGVSRTLKKAQFAWLFYGIQKKCSSIISIPDLWAYTPLRRGGNTDKQFLRKL